MNPVELNKRLGIEGFMHPDELEALIELAVNKDVLEIGSYKGSSARWMACVAKSVTCADTFKACDNGQDQTGDTLKQFISATDRFKNVTCVIGRSSVASVQLRDKSFDLIFLDAMHTYEEVKEDIERWWPLVRNGGVMAFHDYGHDDFPGVKKAVDYCLSADSSGEHVITIPLTGLVGTLAWVTKP